MKFHLDTLSQIASEEDDENPHTPNIDDCEDLDYAAMMEHLYPSTI